MCMMNPVKIDCPTIILTRERPVAEEGNLNLKCDWRIFGVPCFAIGQSENDRIRLIRKRMRHFNTQPNKYTSVAELQNTCTC